MSDAGDTNIQQLINEPQMSHSEAQLPTPVVEVKVEDSSQNKGSEKEGWRKVRSISRIIHLFSAAYIIGQTFTVFLYGSQFDLRDNYASFILEIIFIVGLVISGLLNIWSILRIFEENTVGKSRWIWSNMINILLTIFYTRILDLIILSWSGAPGQMALSWN